MTFNLATDFGPGIGAGGKEKKSRFPWENFISNGTGIPPQPGSMRLDSHSRVLGNGRSFGYPIISLLGATQLTAGGGVNLVLRPTFPSDILNACR
jgi:hypothetical protein